MGIVKCGAWGCFDEFNRLKEDQLSAISQQIQLIQAAIKDRQTNVTLFGSQHRRQLAGRHFRNSESRRQGLWRPLQAS